MERAKLRVVRSKARLTDALRALKTRLLPRTIARNLLDATREKADDAAEAGVDAVKARPGIAIGVAGLATLFLARKPIARAISSDEKETPPAKTRSPRKPAPGSSTGRKPVRKGQS